MRRSLAQFNFISGELSPKLWRRPDLDKYLTGARRVYNMVIDKYGGAQRRMGSIYVDTVKDNAASRLIPFRRSSGTNLIIELTANVMRFYESGALIESGGSPVELATPWGAAEIDGVRFDQTGDVMYLTHPNYIQQKLSRTSATSFTIADISHETGPFLDENTDETKTLQLGAATGSTTMTASGHAPFTADHVGSLWKLRWQDRSALSKWSGSTPIAPGTVAISRGKAFKSLHNATTGVNAPDHTEGSEWDGDAFNSNEWEYLHSGYVIVKVTGYTSSTVVAVDVLGNGFGNGQAPADVVSAGTKYWLEGAWSDAQGWPETVGFYNDRLVYTKGNELYFSQNRLFENFSPTDEHGDIVTTSGLRFVMSDSQANSIRWIKQMGQDLLVGTTGSEWSIGPGASQDPFGPDNVFAEPHTFHGTADFIQPLRVNDVLLFVSRSRRTLQQLAERDYVDQYSSNDISVLSEHLLNNALFEADFARSPHGVYWAIDDMGSLIGMTFDPNQEVVGWHQHALAGSNVFVESIATIPSDDETYDEVWMIVARTINGSTKRYVERLATPFEDLDGDITQGVFVDSAKVTTGSALASVTLAHLPNATGLAALVDGKPYVGLSSDGSGVVALPDGVTGDHIICGYGYTSELTTLTLDSGSQIGAGIGKRQSVHRFYTSVEETNVYEFRRGGVTEWTVAEFNKGGSAMDAPLPLFTGIDARDIGMHYETEPYIEFRQALPVPLTIRGVSWDINIANQ